MTKNCGVCKQDLPIEFFHRKRDGHQYKCKSCTSKYLKEHYKNNKQRYLTQVAVVNKRRREALRELVNQLKKGPCKDCGKTWPAEAMDFDHLHGKTMAVSKIFQYGSERRVLEEIKKCELVCACCHRVRTMNRRSKSAR